jgi:hypothetical protein
MVETHNLPGGKKKYFCDLCDTDFDTIQDAISHENSCTRMGRNYADWTVKELKETLKERGLPVSGKKHVLIERLENRMATSKPTSEENNYLEEWALYGTIESDAKDADLVKQIREKYRAPSYKTRSKREKTSYPLKLSIAIIVLCFIGICGSYFYEMELEIERQGGNSEKESIGCFTSLLLFIILFQSVYNKNKEMDLTSQDKPPVVNFLTAIGVLGFLLAIYLNFFDGNLDEIVIWDRFTCCSSLILLIIPLALFSTESADEKLKKDEQMERIWEDAQKHEERNQFDAAMEIWSKLGEEGEVERVTRLKTECLCVILKRKIKDLTEQGVNCTQLEEQWATIETDLEEAATSPSSIGTGGEEVALTVEDSTITPSPDINLEEHTGESLKEIEEDEHTLVKNSVISKSNIGAGEDDKFSRLEKLTEMKEKGLIDDDDYEKMKREIIG